MARLTHRVLSLFFSSGTYHDIPSKQTVTVGPTGDCDGVNSDGRREGQILGEVGEESNPTRSRLSVCTDGGYKLSVTLGAES
jgi:hypothetical protein